MFEISPLNQTPTVILYNQGISNMCFAVGRVYIMEKLKTLLTKLDDKKDSNIIKQLCAIIYRYLEKRGRL